MLIVGVALGILAYGVINSWLIIPAWTVMIGVLLAAGYIFFKLK